jgi:hypothetical protein
MSGRRIMVAVVVLLAGALALTTVGSALAWGPGGVGSVPFWGMMGGYGPGGVGSNEGYPGGMMGGYRGGMMGGGYGPWSQAQPQGPAIGMENAVQSAQDYLKSYGNQDLTLDEVMEFQYNYYALVKEKSTGLGAFELLIDKYTGSTYPEMGPNMMWNSKYGMMYGRGPGMMGRGMMGGWNGSGQNTPDTPMTVTADQAKETAQKWLDANQPGSTTETPDRFYGYYTVHTLKNGKVSGMLSVNGYNGQVWYHSWHGDFVQLKEMGS